jgi:hypothetical protein
MRGPLHSVNKLFMEYVVVPFLLVLIIEGVDFNEKGIFEC